jgi:nitric oxide reductase NorD protein
MSHSAADIQRACEMTAVALSDRRRTGARLMSGERSQFSLSANLATVHVPYPAPSPTWTLRTYTCGVALQCAPSKDRVAQYPLHQLSRRELAALALVEGGVALGWLARRWPGLLTEAQRALPGLAAAEPGLGAVEMLSRADMLARSRQALTCYPLLGTMPMGAAGRRGPASGTKRFGRMPWSSRRSDTQRLMSIPIGGEGGARNTGLPPASRPEDDDPDIRADLRAGIPYPEWNAWSRYWSVATPVRGAVP